MRKAFFMFFNYSVFFISACKWLRNLMSNLRDLVLVLMLEPPPKPGGECEKLCSFYGMAISNVYTERCLPLGNEFHFAPLALMSCNA